MIKNIKIILSTFSFYIFGFLSTVLLLPPALLFAYTGLRHAVRKIARFWCRLIFLCAGKRLIIKGMENIEKGKPYLLLANHTSLFDIMAVMAFMPEIYWIGKEYLIKIPLFGTFLKKWGYLPIFTKSIKKSRQSIETAVRIAKLGKTIGIFPEGTRTIDGSVQDFKRGFLTILKNSRLDVLPVTLNGLFELKPKTRRLFLDPDEKLEVIIHPPIKNKSLIHKSDQEIISQIKAIIENGCRCKDAPYYSKWNTLIKHEKEV